MLRKSQLPYTPEDVLGLAPWIPAGPVLDLGCGRGDYALKLSEYGFEVTALDLHDAIPRLQQQKPQVSWLQQDLRQFVLKKEHWAAIVVQNVTPFLPQADIPILMRRLKAALKPKGILVFSGFNADDPAAENHLARTQAQQPAPTGLIALADLERYFKHWQWWFAFEGRVEDDHPPMGPHQHGLSQMIAVKPESALQTQWQELPRLGVGIGWRPALAQEIQSQQVDFLEIMSDDYLDPRYDRKLLALSKHYPIIPHGVELSIGSPAAPDPHYLEDVARVVRRCNSPWWSDHLCYTRSPRYKTFSLNPLPPTEEALEIVIQNIRAVKEQIPRPLLLENVAYYAQLAGEMSEVQFLRRVLEEADCGLLLDVANLFGNAYNMGIEPRAFVEALPRERVVQVHLAGGQLVNNLLFDTHNQPIWQETWDLLKFVLKTCDIRAISLERDANYAEPAEIVGELKQARQLLGLRL